MKYIYHDVVVEHRYWQALVDFAYTRELHGINSIEAADAWTSLKDAQEALALY